MYTSRTPNDMAARIDIFICRSRLVKVIGMPMNVWTVYLEYERIFLMKMPHILPNDLTCNIRKVL